MPEQRNPYRGSRAWLRLPFQTKDGSVHRLDLMADTGSPAGLILRPDLMALLAHRMTGPRESNLGSLDGGWLRLYAPELGLVELVRGYGNDNAANIARRSHPDFVAVVGLPVLRLAEYGGNADEFWIRTPTAPSPPHNPAI